MAVTWRRLLVLVIAFAGIAYALRAAGSRRDVEEPVQAERGAGRTRIVLLGTGTPNAEPDRWGTAVAIVVDDTPYLVDLGPGVVRRANAARRAGIEGLALSKLRVAFITHLHSDHTVGYADFILSPWVEGRDRPAEVYGPPGTQAMTEHILAAYEDDIRIRTGGLQPSNSEGYKVEAHEIEPGLVYEDERVRVRAFPVQHGSWSQAFGYRFDTPDRSVVISGDARPSDSVIENCRGCDVLIHEVYSQAGFERRAPEWQRYHASSHTSTLELGRIAAEARPGLLVLYHTLPWGSTPEQMLAEIGQVYDGRVVYGNDLDVF